MTESLYRKYRPQTFADVVGQEPIERTLRNALAQNKVSHAYLFCGPRGTGKTTTARLMAKAILCEKGMTPDPDGTCESCQMIADGTHPDVYELDAASRTGVDNVREEIIGRVHFAPTVGRAKIYIIDEVHMLSIAAFNALLKTLEEPPEHVVFILCTTDPNRVPATIHSRCQRFDFHRISVDQIVARLGAVCVEEDVTFEPEALELIAEQSDGGMRNALTSLEQLIVFSEGNVTRAAAEDLLGSLDSSDLAEIVGAIGRRDAAACFVWMADYVETGADLAHFATDLAEHIRALYILGLVGDDAPLELSDTERAQLMKELPYFGTDRLARLLMIIGDLMNELRTTTNPRLSFEIALTRMVHPSSDLTLESLAERIETLEKGMAARPAVPAVATAPAAPAAVSVQPQAAPAQASPAFDGEDDPYGIPDDYVPFDALEAEPASTPAPAPRPQAYRAPASASAPAPAPAPQPAPAPAAAEPAPAPVSCEISAILANPAALQRGWQAAMAALKKEHAAYGVLFMNAQVTADVAQGALRATFPATNKFAFMGARKPEVYEALQRAIQKGFGTEVPVQYYQEGSGAAPAVPSTDSAAPAAAPASAPAPQQAAPQAPAQAPRFQRPAPSQPQDQAAAPQQPSAPQAAAPQQPSAPQAAAPQQQPASAPQQRFQRPQPASQPAPAQEVPSAPASAALGGAAAANDGDIASILAAGFGAGAVFKEVE